MALTHDQRVRSLQQQAQQHLLLHFTRNGELGAEWLKLLVLERGEGPYVFDVAGNRYFDGLSSLFCAQIGYSYGEEMASAAAGQMAQLAFNTNWATVHPPVIELAERLAELAPGNLNRAFFTFVRPAGTNESDPAATCSDLSRLVHQSDTCDACSAPRIGVPCSELGEERNVQR